MDIPPLPFVPQSPLNIWYQAWRLNIRNAKQYPDQSWGYSQAAVVAYAQHLCYLAQEMARQ